MLGLLLLLGSPPVVPGPAFVVGDETLYVGETQEVSERLSLPYRRRSARDVRLFVLDVERSHADLAMLIRTKPLDDPTVMAAVKIVSGTSPREEALASARLVFVRVDSRGRAFQLRPAPALPLALARAERVGLAPECDPGLFVPRPEAPPREGDTFADGPVRWTVGAASVWNGAQVVELAGTLPGGEPRRDERVWVSSADGLPRVVHRQSEQFERMARVHFTRSTLEMQPPTPHRGEGYALLRNEIEQAYAFAVSPPTEALAAKIERYRRETPPTSFRDAIDAAARRCAAGLRGELVPDAKAAALKLGERVPDFLATDCDGGTLKLSGLRGRPVVLVFFRPQSPTSAGALEVAEALAAKFPRAAVLPLAVADFPAARTQRLAMKLRTRVYDGSACAVESWPRYLLLDAEGVLRWQFEGHGAETGYLAREELERLGR